MKEGFAAGLTAEIEHTITPDQGITHLGPDVPSVLSTPAMIALMERTTVRLLSPYLEESEGSVGVHVDVSHTAPTPIGAKVKVTAALVSIEGRRLTFKVEAHNDKGKFGEGTHKRVIIDRKRFASKPPAIS
jgi:predicted thioesterase